MNLHYRELIAARRHAQEHVVLWTSTYRGRVNHYVVFHDRLVPLAEWLERTKLSPAEAALVARSVGNELKV
jgi:hypothetical protein